MKKSLIAMTMLAGAVTVYSQGTVNFNDYNGSFGIQVWNVQSTAASTVSLASEGFAGWFEEQGNTANSYLPNAGSKTYSGAPLTGGTWDVELFAASGTSATMLSQLTPITSTLTSSWNTSPGTATAGAVGTWNSTAVPTLNGITTTATFAVAAWKNSGVDGAATTLAAAQADGYLWGVSDIVTGTVATGNENLPYLPANLTDFSMAISTPEPSTIALGVLGASALLFRRRK